MSRHGSSVGLRWPSKRIAALHRLPIRSVLAARCALRCAPMAARSLRHLIRDATLALPIQSTASSGPGRIGYSITDHRMNGRHRQPTRPRCPSIPGVFSTIRKA
ncbi:hypothetical protein [Verminephrobacter eiseniae]|uniref:hypothetical protein n=1 Tax=Verminephrobacter eiseniae TaxID=364317 RepID=UPI001E612078|nr:hypothetical protein [Verminephrobacter eiseniae]